MELVGMEIRKNFPGFGVFTGTVQSYDAGAGYFHIQYEDGDSEDVDFEEIASILREMGRSSPNLKHHARRSNQGCPPKKRTRLDSDPAVRQGTVVDFEDGAEKSELDETLVLEKEGFFKENGHFLISDEIQANGDCNGDEGRMKRPKMSAKDESTPDMTHRKRARRASRAMEFESALVSQDDDLGGGRRGFVSVPENPILTKPELPPSSKDLDLDGLNVFDLLSVYTCLRSFSRLLFLSPFTVEDFVAALKCSYANFLIDSIHFSILQALKPHLELLSEEGSRSASDCLRYLSWEHLDLVTWPVFLVHYLAIHDPGMKPGFILGRLKLLDSEYYIQPAAVKLEMLRCLCDYVIEVAAIRSELNRRMGPEMHVDASCNNMDIKKRRKSFGHTDPLVGEGPKEIDDGNFDECCLCGMDGSLICCDGCPAAFHSRCVGVAKDLLPEGEWYCPECLVEKSDGLVNMSKPFCGAELLGVDPHGRLYFGSCNRLLVSDSYESDALCHYYIKDDLGAVIAALKPCYAYSAILNAISMYWGFSVDASPSNKQSRNVVHDGLKEDLSTPVHSEFPSKLDVLCDVNAGSPPVVGFASSEQCGFNRPQLPDLANLNSVIADELVGMSCPFSCSEPFDENTHASSCIQRSQQTNPDCPMHSPSMQVTSIEPTDITAASEKYIGFPKKVGYSELHSNHSNYINYYSFGRIATSISAVLMHKSVEGNTNEFKKSIEDIKSAQLIAISQISTKGYYHVYQKLYTDVQNENCGWCLSCKTSSDLDCLFKVAVNKKLKGSRNKDIDSFKSKDEDARRQTSEKNKNSHITSAVHFILSIEDRAGSLLSGPWEKPRYRQHWRKAVMKADTVASLKPLLLSLEFHLRRVALSIEWSKPVDDAHAIISSSIVTSPVRVSSSYVGSRQQGKKNIVGDGRSCVSRHAAISDIYWWRGGRQSRQLFQCKMLPRALASKGGRQAGCKKIPHMLYPDGLDFAKRSKYVSWRVAVEMSQSVAQFIYQAKDFDANIKWAELSDTRRFPKLTNDSKKLAKGSKKMTRQMKMVTICGKCKEGEQVKYLLDFSKIETVPAIVTKHGVLLEESTVGRKRYWLTETHVPLNLLKSYEEKTMKKRIARLEKKTDSGAHHANETKFKTKKRKRSEWLSYLLSKEQKSEKQLCAHCNKGVSIRDAVNCQFCGGIFHRKHFRIPKGAVDVSYMCNRCKDAEAINLKTEDTKSVKAKNNESNNVKSREREAKEEDIKSTNSTCRVVTSVSTKNVNAKEDDIKDMNSAGRIVTSVDVDSKNEKAKEDTMKNMNLTDRVVTNVDVKMKGIKGVNAKKDIKPRMARDKGKKSREVEENLRSERVKQKGIRSLEVKPLRLKIVFKGRTVSEDRELDAIPKKGKHTLLKSEKFHGHKRVKNGKSKSMKSENIENVINWHKRKRSVVYCSYWLNGLLWTRKLATEQQRDFRERNIILPFQNIDQDMKPLCSLCCQEYNSGVTYICCERCQVWFHGDAFCLTVENIDNLVGFRCHKCRLRSEPICPFLENAVIGNVDLDTERKIEVNVVCNDDHNDEDNVNSVSNGHQDDEYRHCSSPIVCEGSHLDDRQTQCHSIEHKKDEEKGHGCLHEIFSATGDNEDRFDESQSKNIPEEKPSMSTQAILTNGYTLGLQHMNNWKRSFGEACEDCAVVKSQDRMDEERSVIVPKKELALCSSTLSANVDNVQSPQQVEENVATTKNENETEVGLALHGVSDELY